jgi:hypothetical protein
MVSSAGAIRAGRAFVELFADDSRLVRGLKSAQTKLKGFANFTQTLGAGMFGGAATIATPIVMATKLFSDFSDTMLAVKAGTGATADEFKMLDDEAKRLGATTSFTAKQAAGMMLELGRAGFRPQQVMDATGAVLNLARATETDLPMAAAFAGAALQQFGLDSSQMTRTARLKAWRISARA